jgi:phenylacetate-CoA oxygenase PaaH subunit
MEIWEVLVQEDRKKFPINVGSVRAPNETLALEFAREIYARRERPVRVMVVNRAQVHIQDSEARLAVGPDKRYRLPSLGRKVDKANKTS